MTDLQKLNGLNELRLYLESDIPPRLAGGILYRDAYIRSPDEIKAQVRNYILAKNGYEYGDEVFALLEQWIKE